MATFYLGQILLVPYNFVPRGCFACDGSLLPISQYTALFSLLGTTYGGNGQSNFALPDLRGRVPLGAGDGPGLSPRVLGEIGGVESTSEVPSHSHQLAASSGLGTTDQPQNAVPAAGGSYAPTSAENVFAASTQPDGLPSGVEVMNPFTTMQYVICVEGIYPSPS